MASGTSAMTYHSWIPVIFDNTFYILRGINKDGFNSPGDFTALLAWIASYSDKSSAEMEHYSRYSLVSFCSCKCK